MSSNKLKSGVSRVDARLLLQVLHHIATNDHVSVGDLMQVTGLSKASLKRMMLNAGEQYGIDIKWARLPGYVGNVGVYVICDWGVFDPVRVSSFISSKAIYDAQAYHL